MTRCHTLSETSATTTASQRIGPPGVLAPREQDLRRHHLGEAVGTVSIHTGGGSGAIWESCLPGLPQESGESVESVEAVVLEGNLSTRYGGGSPPPARLRRMIRTKRQALLPVVRRG